jgi:type I restriction enzyme S subunit
LHKSDYVDSGIPIINPKHINESKIFPKEKISKEKAESLSEYFLNNGDVIMARRGEMGRVAYIGKEQEGWFCGTGSLIIRLQKGYMGRFYGLLLSSDRTINYLSTNSRGVTMANLNKDIIEKIPIPKLGLDVQKKIITQIEKEQDLINANKQLIEIFEQKIKDRIAKVWGK